MSERAQVRPTCYDWIPMHLPSRSQARCGLGAALLLVACSTGPTRHDAYMEALAIEGEAERGPCKLTFDAGIGAQVLSSGQVAACLEMQEKALAAYERAAALGMKGDAAFEKAHARAKERRDRLRSMLTNVARLERDQVRARLAREPAAAP